MEHYTNIDEHLQKLNSICDVALEKYKIYDDESEAGLKKGLLIHPDLVDKLATAKKEFLTAAHNYNTFIAFCSKNKLDLTAYWTRLGFSEKEIQKMIEEDQN